MRKQFHGPCTIYLIRHGQTEWNVESRMQGQLDSPLTTKGLKQARLRAKDLSQINFVHIFSSDLLRAIHTANIIATEHQLVVATHQLLRERNYGSFEGKKVEEFRQQLQDLLEQREKLSQKERFSFKLAPDIESDEEIVNRLILFLREVSVAYAGQTVAAVSHGGIIINFLNHLGFINKGEIWVDNLAYIVIKSDGVDFNITHTEGLVELKND